MSHKRRIGALAGAALLAAAAGAQGQTMSTSSASFEAGYGRAPGQENRPVDPGTRDANGNRVIVDGIIQTGADQSVYARANAWGAGDAFAGAGATGGATAIGNNLVVVTQGSWNTVVIDSTQINNGDVSAGATSATGAAASATAKTTTAAKAAPLGVVSGSTLGAGGVGDLNGEIDLDAAH
jgi:holdfast attachment protein HfaA